MSRQVTRWMNRDAFVVMSELGWGIDEWDSDVSGHVTFDAQRCLNYIIGKLDEFDIDWGDTLRVTFYTVGIVENNETVIEFKI